MEINVRVHPKSGREEILELGGGNYEVWLKESPEKNKANVELLKILKRYFKKDVSIISGKKSRKKRLVVKDGN